jgi:hypothetical protein
MHFSSSLALIGLLALAPACTPKPADTEGDDGSSGATGTGTGGSGGAEETSATSPTSGGTTGSASDGQSESGVTEDPTATTATVTTANPTTMNPTMDPTSDPGDPLSAACEKLCDALADCGLAPPGKECIEGCVGDEEPGSECAALLAELWECVAPLPCDELEKFLEDAPAVCLDQVEAYDSQCAASVCGMFAGGGPDSCSVGLSCDGLEQEYRCEGEFCTCIENEVPGMMCPNKDFCTGQEPNFGEMEAAAQACCGWDWS